MPCKSRPVIPLASRPNHFPTSVNQRSPKRMSTATHVEDPDVILIGSGVMSANLGAMLKRLDPRLSIQLYEASDGLAQESSDGWNNAGTGHAGICELSYTPKREADGSVKVAKVIEIGPLAYKHRDTMAGWPEGSWADVGDFIRVPKWGGDRWEVHVPGEDKNEDPALFMVLNDHEVIAKLTGDPLAMRAFL